MSSPFPQLLRRANIATYDPLITRIYTSTNSSKAQHSDWGLKFPIHLPKGPRYIKFSSLDAGPGFNCDWRSAEREARFMNVWGNGGVRWTNEDEVPRYTIRKNMIYEASDLVEEEEGGQVWMRDVESMSEDDFEAFLDRVREGRKRFLSQTLEGMAESTRASLQLPEDRTLVHLATAGKVSEGATAMFQAQLTADDLIDPHSTKINSRPHRVHGLNYSRPPTSSTDHNPISERRGRALNKVNRADDAHAKARVSAFGRPASSSRNDNLPWVVGLGGLTAKTQSGGKMGDAARSNTIDQTDYTRSDPQRGVGNFRIARAQMDKSPTVLALKESRAGGQFGGKWRQSGASLPSPLDTFKFDIDVSLASASSPSSSSSSPSISDRALEVGSREWVGRERKVASYVIPEFGGPKNQRRRGEAADRLREAEARRLSKERVDSILQKLKEKNLGAKSGSA